MHKALVYKGNHSFDYGDKKQNAPAPDEVTIDVAFCGICGTDLHVFHGNMDARVGFDRILGHEMSGTISAIGAKVKDYSVGDHVVVRPLDHCGHCPACFAGHTHICHKLNFIGLDSDGAMQEKWNVSSKFLHKLPKSVRLDHGALVEPLAVACHDVSLAEIKKGEDVLVIGGGPIGILVALVAREAGGNVTISEVNDARISIANRLGFTTINPKIENVQEAVDAQTKNKRMDVIFEVSGTQAGVNTMTEAAATRARIVMVAIHAKKPEIDLFQFFWRELKLLGARVYTPEDYEKAINLIAEKAFDVDHIITDIVDLKDAKSAFEELGNTPAALKTLLRIGG